MAQNDQPSTPRLTILTTDHYKGKLMTNNVIGLRWERRLKPPATLHPQFEIYWGIPFKNLNGNSDWNLQESGIHFQLSLLVF